MQPRTWRLLLLFAALGQFPATVHAAVPVDLAGAAASDPVRVTHVAGTDRVVINWPASDRGARAQVTLNLAADKPLFESLQWQTGPDAPVATIAEALTPLTVLTVGERNLARNGWMVFFDKVHTRPSQRFPARLTPKSARVTSSAARGRISIEGLQAGAFSGRFELTVFAGIPLVFAEAVLQTAQDGRAILYDAGLVAPIDRPNDYAWIDPRDGPQRAPADTPGSVRAARHRVVAAGFAGGSVAVFPPPHRFLYPLDFADNFGFNWVGRHYDAAAPGDGIGIRQPPAGDNRFVPWVNAPPGTEQRLGVFYHLGPENAADALNAVARYTRNDRYAALPGYQTFTSHYHVEHTLDLLRRQESARSPELPAALREPGFVRTFRDSGIDIVHLAEFHNGRTPKLGASDRLRQLRLMHAECARLSDERFLLLPGEEPNVHLGGHWISFFPRPVLWVLNRAKDEPFAETTPEGETLYRVGSPADVLQLMQRERGLMWTAHARIKGSIAFPDGYRETPFFRSPQFLGAAWKAMPADYAHDRLGARVLDLLDDMNNWGEPKFALGEVDVFKVEPHYEFYGHANINYVRLDRIPRFADGWQPLLDVLRRGDFFVTTGEVLASDFAVTTGAHASVRAKLGWAFPLAYAEMVAGDGETVVRKRIDLSNTHAFGAMEFTATLPERPAGARPLRWVRLEVWDVATNGAFTQPVRLDAARP